MLSVKGSCCTVKSNSLLLPELALHCRQGLKLVWDWPHSLLATQQCSAGQKQSGIAQAGMSLCAAGAVKVAHFFLVSVSAVPGAKCWNTSACFSKNCSRLLALPLCRRQDWQHCCASQLSAYTQVMSVVSCQALLSAAPLLQKVWGCQTVKAMVIASPRVAKPLAG